MLQQCYVRAIIEYNNEWFFVWAINNKHNNYCHIKGKREDIFYNHLIIFSVRIMILFIHTHNTYTFILNDLKKRIWKHCSSIPGIGSTREYKHILYCYTDTSIRRVKLEGEGEGKGEGEASSRRINSIVSALRRIPSCFKTNLSRIYPFRYISTVCII